MSKINGLIHHIEIFVSDLQKSKIFWKELLEDLQYVEYQDWKEGVSWKLGDTYIVFVQTKEKYLDIPYHRCGTGLNHIAFHIESKDMIDTIALKLIEKGINLLYNDKFRKQEELGPYSIFFEDPDRMKIELVYSG